MEKKDTDSGLMLRGLLLLGLMAVLAGIVLYVVLRRPHLETPVEAAHAAGPASARGWEIRYNATAALARRGSPRVPLDVLREMLDEEQQMRNFRVTLKGGQEVADESAARSTVLSALKATVAWHTHADAVRAVGADNPQLQQVFLAIDKLTHSPNLVVRTEAEKTRQALKRT